MIKNLDVKHSSSPRSFIGDLLKRCPIKEFGHDGTSILE